MSIINARDLLTVATCAVAVLVLADLALQRSIPLTAKPREVQEGIRDLLASDPETLVIGSSHARTFHVLGLELQKRLGATSLPLVAIPLENGKLIPYLWLLEQRVAPIVDERTRQKPDKPPRLRRLFLLTEWWDSCDLPDGVHWNIPSRAWALRDYLRDVATHGVNDYNRNFPRTVLREIAIGSALIQDRTNPRIKDMLLQRARGGAYPPPWTPDNEAAKVQQWQRMVEDGVGCMGAPDQMEAFVSILDFAQRRGLDMTVVLFPRKPVTLTEHARKTTIRQFADMIAGITSDRGVRLIDLTVSTPLTDTDFMDDFDHVNVDGNLKFARWALENDLRFLLDHKVVPVDGSRHAEDRR